MATPETHEPALRRSVAEAITASGIARCEVARSVDMSPNALDRLLDGPGRFPVSALIRIGDLVGVKASTLLERAEADTP